MIASAAVNSDFSDIATALTGSIASNGVTPLTAPIKFVSGQPSAPGITFVIDTTTGLYLPATGQLGMAADGALALLVDGTQTGVSDNNISNANGAVLCPVGTIMDWPGATAPTGWYLLYGQVLAIADYPGLYAVLGTTYNTGGEGEGNFRLPDCRGRLTAGVDNMGGTAANRITSAGSGIAGTTLGASGGSQNETIEQTNLPDYDLPFSLAFTGVQETWDLNQSTPSNVTAGIFTTGGGDTTGPGITPTVTVTPAGSISGSVALDGDGNALTTMPPTIIFNKIIFGGR